MLLLRLCCCCWSALMRPMEVLHRSSNIMLSRGVHRGGKLALYIISLNVVRWIFDKDDNLARTNLVRKHLVTLTLTPKKFFLLFTFSWQSGCDIKGLIFIKYSTLFYKIRRTRWWARSRSPWSRTPWSWPPTLLFPGQQRGWCPDLSDSYGGYGGGRRSGRSGTVRRTLRQKIIFLTVKYF